MVKQPSCAANLLHGMQHDRRQLQRALSKHEDTEDTRSERVTRDTTHAAAVQLPMWYSLKTDTRFSSLTANSLQSRPQRLTFTGHGFCIKNTHPGIVLNFSHGERGHHGWPIWQHPVQPRDRHKGPYKNESTTPIKPQ